MKKNELKQGVAYFVSSDNRISGYWDSIQRTHEANISRRAYVIFKDGQPETQYRTPSSVYVSRCKNYGIECETHKEYYETNNRIGCNRKAVRLMDIRGNYYEIIARTARAHKARNADGGRGARYLRHVENKQRRDREAYVKPIKAQLWEAINAATGASLGDYYSDLNRLTPDQMKALTEALSVKAVN